MEQGRAKRKRDTAPTPVCIVHVDNIRHGDLHLLSELKDAQKKLTKLQEVKAKRLAQPPGSSHRMKETCDRIPDRIEEHHGIHWECYKRYTMNLDRLMPIASTSQAATDVPQQRTSRSNSGDNILFKPDCIFCGSESRKRVKVQGSWTSQGLSQFEYDGGKSVLEMAVEKQDGPLLTRIRGQDLFACEAKYHKTCRQKYMQKPEKWQSADEKARQDQLNLEESHRKAFEAVCHIVENDVLNNLKVLKLTDLRNTYTSELENTKHANPDYRSEKLKHKLEVHEPFKNKLSFCDMGKFQSYIVFSSAIDVNSAVKQAFQLGSTDVIEQTGKNIRQSIMDAYSTAPELKWPPNPSDLATAEDVMPDILQKLLSYIITGKTTPTSTQSQRLVQSIAQDICRAATGASWKLRKHVLICLTLRHLFRSEKLITFMNRMGHCESYSFALELETALAESAIESSTHLSNQIIKSPQGPSLFHSEFDNFDSLVNDLTGKGSVHTAHGIMLQDVDKDDDGQRCPELPTQTRTKQRSLHLTDSVSLPDCYVTKRQSPMLQINQLHYPEATASMEASAKLQMIWIMIRMMMDGNQKIPGWAGFISETGLAPDKLTTIDYYPVINQPITEYKTVQECLRVAEEATKEVGQTYVLTTLDLGVCMKAFPLTWNAPEKYANHIILIGTFHLVCAYMRVIGKKMAGSGLADVLMESGLISGGSLAGVMSGKHYDRALNCHKVMMESLERLLLQAYLESQNADDLFSSLSDESSKQLHNLMENPSHVTLDAVLTEDSISLIVKGYEEFRQSVATGHLGKTAQLWLSYMEHVHLMLSLLEAVKTNNFFLYAECINRMTPLFFSFDGQNYARYLSYFSVFLANIDSTHPGAASLIKRGAISVARSFIPGNRCAVDKTMEETFMRHAKSRAGAGTSAAGVSGVLTNYNAYQRWVRSAHARSLYVDATLDMARMVDSQQDTKHRDVRPTEVKRGEKLVNAAKDAINSFLNPFAIDTKDQLLIISSGSAASETVTKDVLGAEAVGKKARDEFIENRLKPGESFFEPVKRQNLKTLANMNKTAKTQTAKSKVAQYKQQGNVAFQLFVKSQNQGLQLDLKELMGYPLTVVPFSLATADGYLAKTDKAKAFHHLTKDYPDADVPPVTETLTVYDGNACFYYLKDIPGDFRQIGSKVFDMIGKAGDVIFSTDQYLPESVKSMERRRRGCGEKLLLKGEATKRPPDWKSFLSNDDNKVQFIKLLLKLWSGDQYAARLHRRRVVFICEGAAYLLTSADGRKTLVEEVPMLKSTQEETDSRVVLYANYARSQNYQYARVKSPDSDVFFILLHYASTVGVTVMFDTGTGNKQRLIDVSKIAAKLGHDQCTAFMALHAYSGCDSTSAFRWIGKLKPLKTLQRLPKYIPTLKRLGDTWDVPDEDIGELESFTCAIYGRASKVSKVDDLRFIRINEVCAKESRLVPSATLDMATFPPCKKSLTQHIRRVNHQVGIWKRAHIPKPSIPKASQGHGWEEKGGYMDPIWYEGDALPRELIDIAQREPDTVSSDSDSDSDSDVDSQSDIEYGLDDDSQESEDDE